MLRRSALSPRGFPAAAILLGLLFATIGGVTGAVVAPPAAEAVLCPRWTDEIDMANQPPGACRDTWLVEPGQGQLMGRAQLLRAEPLYGAFGFARQWLWYAPMATISLNDVGRQWVSCDDRDGEFCRPDQVDFTANSVIDNFDQRPLQLHVFSYGNRHIARACGNFLKPFDDPRNPVPRVRVEKFDDRNRNGVRDAGESGLAGWQFRVERVSSQFQDQPAGVVATVATGPDGTLEFPFNGHGPGVYAVEEVGQDGWAPTTAARQTVVVPDGVGDATVASLRFGNAQTRADLVKATFSLVDPPARIEAGQPTDLVVRVNVRNDGPADVTARDTVDVEVPADCTVEPAHAQIALPLLAGQQASADFGFRITCTEPSFHPVLFTDHLSVLTPGVEDPDPSDNTLAFEHVFPVFHRADVALNAVDVECPARSDVGEEFRCTVSATVANAGPYTPVTAEVTAGLQPPADCTAADVDGSAAQHILLAAGEPRTVTSQWRVVCAHRSFHDITATVRAVLDHLHVEDPVPGNADGSAQTRIEIFEPADLAVENLSIRCTEREASTTASSCTATVLVRNLGPATAVVAVASLAITPAADCTAAPAPTQSTPLLLDAGASQQVTAVWALTCTGTERHAVRVSATVRTDEPHAEDRVPANNTTTAVWGPLDVKPRSLPSSVSIGKAGLVPFAVLSTATLNALTDVDRTTLRIGATGTEASVVSCAPTGEDVNDDGRADLVCHADTQRMGLQCDTQVVLLTGRLTDGTPFYAEDDVKIVGCRP